MIISSRMSSSSSTTSTRFTLEVYRSIPAPSMTVSNEMLFLRMPSITDWLKASWGDFRRRWAVLLAVAGVGGGATMAAGFLPFIPASLATIFGVGPVWVVWGAAAAVS